MTASALQAPAIAVALTASQLSDTRDILQVASMRSRRRIWRRLRPQAARWLIRVREVLSVLPAGSQAQFLTTGKGSLGGATPFVALGRGQTKAVIRAAEGFVGR